MLVSSDGGFETSVSKTRNSIGGVIFSKTDKYTQDHTGAKTFGYVKGNYRELIVQGKNLVIFHREENLKFYAKIEKIENYPITAGGFETSITETATRLHLRPFYEIAYAENYKGQYRPHNMMGLELDFPNSNELMEMLNIPQEGLVLGNLVESEQNIPFNYPLHPEDTIFQSVFIAGVQGSGKTNFTKMLVNSLHSKTNTAMVILDREGEYGNFTDAEKMTPDGKKFFEKHGISSVKPNLLRLSNDFFEATATMSIQGIDPLDILMVLPELETKSAAVLRTIVSQAVRNIAESGVELSLPVLEKEVLLELRTSQYLTGMAGSSMRGAIERALISHNLRLFDQNNKTKLVADVLFKEGAVTVIDCQSLSSDQQRMVALYLLLMLNKHKLHEKHREPGVLLFIDEAEVLFPVKPTNGEKDYVQRLEEMAREPVRRGRKHKFGIVAITHRPNDISAAVENLCNTKIAFRTSTAKTWLRDNFGKELVHEIETMETGNCYINTMKTSKQIQAKVSVPFVGDCE